MYIYIIIYTLIYLHTYIHTDKQIDRHTDIHTYIYLNMFCVCSCMFIYVHICSYMFIYVHICSYTWKWGDGQVPVFPKSCHKTKLRFEAVNVPYDGVKQVKILVIGMTSAIHISSYVQHARKAFLMVNRRVKPILADLRLTWLQILQWEVQFLTQRRGGNI